jgi:D-alanyl-D-alanine carboxypeptidase (penicillin-binding protein 5/6)
MKCNNTNEQAGAYSYIDSKTLFEFGFNNYELKALAEPGTIVADTKVYEAKGNVRVSATVPDEVKALIPIDADAETDIEKDAQLPEQIDAPIAKGDKIGTVTYSYDGKDIGKADLVAVNDVERNEIIHAVHISLGVITSPFFFIPVIIIIILIIIANHQRRKRERKRRIQQLKRNKQRRERNSDTGYRSPDRKASRTQIQGEEARGANSRYKDGK